MTKRIFRAIVLAALTVLAAAMMLFLWALYNHFTGVQFDRLREETALAAYAIERGDTQYFDTIGDRLHCRVTWIDSDGAVLYDSQSDHSVMENHLRRQEVREALSTGYGQSSRRSDTLLVRSLYTAQRLADGSVLRLSITQSSALDLLLGMSQFIVVGLAIAIALSFLLASRLSRDIIKPINELNLDDPLSNQDYEEIQPLLQRLESQQNQLRAQAVELRRRQKEFNTVTRALNEGLVLVGSDSTILSINPAASRLLEIASSCLGLPFPAANRNAEISALVEQALAGQKKEAVVSLFSGAYLAAASPVLSQDSVSGVVLLLFDVTQKQRSEALRREFTANVSHEMKTPLHAISGYAELMKSGMVSQADMPTFAAKIYSEAQRMTQLVEDTLRLSGLDEGTADLQWMEADLYDIARTTIKTLSAAAELGRVSLKREGYSVRLRSVPQLLSAIVFNLTDNAIKYNHPGGSVTVRTEEQDGDAVLTVSDTGIGIPAEHHDRIFERFYRVDKSHSREIGGTGLGLSIVKHSARILGGQITLDSTPGVGTTITVRFPME